MTRFTNIHLSPIDWGVCLPIDLHTLRDRTKSMVSGSLMSISSVYKYLFLMVIRDIAVGMQHCLWKFHYYVQQISKIILIKNFLWLFLFLKIEFGMHLSL
jgi:hypothetical protein